MILCSTVSPAHLDQHVPQWQEVAVLQVLNVNDAPGIFSSAALFPSLTLDYRVGANNSKRNTLLFGEENHVHVAVVTTMVAPSSSCSPSSQPPRRPPPQGTRIF